MTVVPYTQNVLYAGTIRTKWTLLIQSLTFCNAACGSLQNVKKDANQPDLPTVSGSPALRLLLLLPYYVFV